ncbi:FAD-binding oxidoreductase [Amaricoccus macauensis]|uniref:FAD-binding oxidoreductase n=1 Tax=Amaricoccus macauensis TaxID=57001 RepID=UPI003C7B821C
MASEHGINPAGPDVLQHIEAAIGAAAMLSPEARYLEEPRGRYHGQAAAILRPASTEEVAAVVRICAEARVGIVPFAGGTGLVGGQIAEDLPAPLVLSFERMNRIRHVDVTDNAIVAEAGVILADVQAAAEAANRRFPLSLASEGTARIGGLLATNAGGLNVLRYGNARDLCYGVEAVMADGSTFEGLRPLMKNNMGYDLRHLLIGSEGTLGLITAASLRLYPIPSHAATAWLAVPSPAAALDLLALARDRMGHSISAFELMSCRGFDFLAETMPQIPQPPRLGTDWIVLTEAEEGPGTALEERFAELIETAMTEGLVEDGLMAQNEAQRKSFWTVRETIPEANRLIGSISSHDVSVPPSQLVTFIDEAGRALAALDPDMRINCFGHLGDGNLHYNVFPPKGRTRADFENLRGTVKQTVHECVHELGGSVGAEHGVGRLKVQDLQRFSAPGEYRAMQRIKSALDPEGILNPGAVIAQN